MKLYKIGLTLVIVAILMLIVASILLLINSSGGGNIGIGGCIVIVFIPICFGIGEHPGILLVTSVILTLVFIMILYTYLRVYSARKHSIY